MAKRGFAFLVCVSAVLALVLPAAAQEPPTPIERAMEYLLTAQNADGGFTNGWAPESDLVTTADVVVAAVAAGQNPEAFQDVVNSTTNYLVLKTILCLGDSTYITRTRYFCL